ncbi:hypothetical protein JCM17823_19670 [Halorubrum gandharaense]
MTDDETASRTRPLPDAWTELESPDEIVTKYSPREPALFEREDRERAVHIRPDEPDLPHADRREWAVGLVRGTADEFHDADRIATVHGRDDAYHVAKTFMAAYEEAVPDAGDDAAALAYAMEQAEAEADRVEKTENE